MADREATHRWDVGDYGGAVQVLIDRPPWSRPSSAATTA